MDEQEQEGVLATARTVVHLIEALAAEREARLAEARKVSRRLEEAAARVDLADRSHGSVCEDCYHVVQEYLYLIDDDE